MSVSSPATKVSIKSLIVMKAYAKTFKTGSTGWFGRVLDADDPTKVYIITGAVLVGSKPVEETKPTKSKKSKK